MRKLTAAAVEKLKPGRYKDAAQGLVLIVHPSGRRVYQFRARGKDGRPRKVVLGAHTSTTLPGEPVIGQPITLAAARVLAAGLVQQRAQKVDVFARAKSPLKANTFAAVATQFIDQHAKRETRRWQGTSRLLGVDPRDTKEIIPKSLADRWRDTPLAEVDGDMIHRAIEDAAEDGVPGRTVRVKQRSDSRKRELGRALSKLFSWALKEKRYVKTNPCRDVSIPKVGKREREMHHDVAALWRAFDSAGDPASRVLKVLLLTGQRLNEIRMMRWSELHVDASDEMTLELPKERTKNGLPHVVPLGKLAREIVEGAPRIKDSPFVFTLNGDSPITIGSKVKKKVDAAAGIEEPWRVHDLRRTASTGMNSIGVQPHVVEAVLNHVSGAKSGVAGVYNRYAYLPEKRAALERWSAHVQRVVDGRPLGNVVPMEVAR